MLTEKALAANRWFIDLATEAQGHPALGADRRASGRSSTASRPAARPWRSTTSARPPKWSRRSATRRRPCRCRARRMAAAGPISATNPTPSSPRARTRRRRSAGSASSPTARTTSTQAKLSGQLPITTSGRQGLDRPSQALRRGELRVAADRQDAAGQRQDARLRRPHSAHQHAARADRRDQARRADEGHRAASSTAEGARPASRHRRSMKAGRSGVSADDGTSP